jgi:hypothetical protein
LESEQIDYCKVCYSVYTDKAQKSCPVCKDTGTTVPRFTGKHQNQPERYFVVFKIEDQLREILRGMIIFIYLIYQDKSNSSAVLQQRLPNEGVLTDICDGARYKEKTAKWGKGITLTFNTDGARLIKSTRNTLWPIFLVINELPADKRYINNIRSMSHIVQI